MKTIQELKEDIESLKDTDLNKLTKRQRSALEKKVDTINKAVLYLERNPKEEFVQKQLEDVQKKIEYAESPKNIKEFMKFNPSICGLKESKAAFQKECGLLKLKQQKQMLNYLLS